MKNNKDKTSAEVNKRFFDALDYIMSKGRIRGVGTFCNDYGLNRIKYLGVRQTIRKTDPADYIEYKNIDVSALVFLCRDFGISTDWLLLGEGKMFKGGI